MSTEYIALIVTVTLFIGGGVGTLVMWLLNRSTDADDKKMEALSSAVAAIPDQFKKQLEESNRQFTVQLEQSRKQFEDQLAQSRKQFEEFAREQLAQAKEFTKMATSMEKAIDKLNYTLEHNSKDGESKVAVLNKSIETCVTEINTLRRHYHDELTPLVVSLQKDVVIFAKDTENLVRRLSELEAKK